MAGARRDPGMLRQEGAGSVVDEVGGSGRLEGEQELRSSGMQNAGCRTVVVWCGLV